MARISLACAAFMAVFCLPSSEGAAYHIHMEEMKVQNNQCFKFIQINWEKKESHFTTACDAEVNQDSILNGILVVGDYTKQWISVYSDEPSSLVTIRRKPNVCSRKIYGRHDPDGGKVTREDCEKYKKEASEEWKGAKKKGSQKNNMYVIMKFKKDGDSCTGTMNLGRSQLRFEEKYDDCIERKVVFTPEGVIIGDYRTQNGVTRVSDTVDTVVSVYPDKICDKITFKESGGSWVPDPAVALENEDCEKYKKNIADWLDKKENEE